MLLLRRTITCSCPLAFVPFRSGTVRSVIYARASALSTNKTLQYTLQTAASKELQAKAAEVNLNFYLELWRVDSGPPLDSGLRDSPHLIADQNPSSFIILKFFSALLLNHNNSKLNSINSSEPYLAVTALLIFDKKLQFFE